MSTCRDITNNNQPLSWHMLMHRSNNTQANAKIDQNQMPKLHTNMWKEQSVLGQNRKTQITNQFIDLFGLRATDN